MVTAEGRYTRAPRILTGSALLFAAALVQAQTVLPSIVPPGETGEDVMICDDLDDDGVLDALDNCFGVFNPAQTDANQNGIGDACEAKPSDS